LDAPPNEESEPSPEQQQQQLAAAPTAASVFIRGLCVLSPRQNSSSNLKDATVALPPLRPEEPVASIRGALTEVVGFAHLTRYRLVVERRATKTVENKSGGANGQSNQKKSSNNGSKKNGAGKKSGKKGHHPQSKDDAIWSPYTSREASVGLSPSLRSLEARGALLPPSKEEEKDSTEKEEEEELVLDEYGDLSALLSLLEVSAESVEEAAATAEEADEGLERKVELDASGIAIRVVLERYDSAGIRDHIARTRQVLEGGNAPYLKSLLGDEEIVEDEARGGDGDEKKESRETVEMDVHKDGKEKDDEPKEETEEEKRARQEAIASRLPSFSNVDHDVQFESSAKGGDLTNFYYLACGEEQTLLELQKEGGGKASMRKMSTDSWMEQNDQQKENKKKGGGNQNKKNRRGSAKNDRSKSPNATNGVSTKATAKNNGASSPAATVSDTDKPHSIVEVESMLHSLNDAARVPVPICLSGYHPPPSHRRVLGDLAYLCATMPDGRAVHITAFPLGFYVNRSTAEKFDPTPIVGVGSTNGTEDACYSHALADCLLRRSPSLRTAWSRALSAAHKRSALLRDVSLNEGDDALAGLFRPAVSPFSDNSGSGSSNASTPYYGGSASNYPTGSSAFVPRIDSLVTRPAWLLSLPSVRDGDFTGPKRSTWDHSALHGWNATRPEEELTNVYGMDVRGGLRDWNEELQTAREMPGETFPERTERARLVHKVLTDFGTAALSGVRAILDGHVLPMNPNEPARSHVHLHNNIFFSRAVDPGPDTFKILQGDAAARKSASRDASNTGTLHRLDVPGLHTLATVLVEYLGQRIVCQSVVPGILHGERSHSLLYGAVETLSALRCDVDMHRLLEGGIGEGCMVATRRVPAHPLTDERMDFVERYRIAPPLPQPGSKENEEDGGEKKDEKEKSVRVCGPVEMKGILGSDGRKYVLDCTRLTPRDANWVSKFKGGTGRWEDHNGTLSLNGTSPKTKLVVPLDLEDDEWTACVLRPELVTNYAEMRINEYLKENAVSARKKDGNKEEKRSENNADADKPDLKESAKPSEVKKDETTGAAAAAEEKDWVDVSKDKGSATESYDKKDDNVNVSHVAKIEEEYIRSLRYNVNVFLPFTRSIELIDEEEHAQLKRDEEEARKLARHLWDKVIPNLTRDVRSSGGKGVPLPADGRSLTELIHRRGINCRYLGRLAELARKEELEDVVAFEKAMAAASKLALGTTSSPSDGTSARAPRFRMPVCWLELLECEMVARAAKHVLDSYILQEGGPSATRPAQTIASFLSAVVSVGEEGAAETERRTTGRGGNADSIDQEEMSALTLFGFAGDDDSESSSPIRGRDEIWSDIESEIGRRYRYTLSLYNTKDGDRGKNNNGRALYAPLLRRICQRSGIRLVAKRYDLGGKCVCGTIAGSGQYSGLAASHPIAPTDVVDVLPLVKHAASASGESFAPCFFVGSGNTTVANPLPSLHVLLSDAQTMYEVGHANLNSGNFAVALDCAREASAMYQRVLDTPVHPGVAKCLKVTAVAHYHRDEHGPALAAAARYLAVSISLDGFDSADVLNAHMTMADILLGTGRVPEGIRHLRAAQFLMELMAGGNYAGISGTYYRMGSHYYEAGRFDDSLRLYELASLRRSEDRMFDCLIARNSAGVLAHLGRFKQAFDHEKKAYQLYVTFLGEEHDATKACSSTLIQLMKLAVEQEKRSKIQEKERVKMTAADAVADQIRADEEAAIWEETKISTNKKSKKKHGGKKKGKK